jgi:hypothetical protein
MEMSKSLRPTTPEQKVSQFTFVNYDLSQDQKKELKGVPLIHKDLLTAILQLTKEGYKITFGWDDWSDCVAVWLIGQAAACKNHGYILTSRAATADKALLALLYKHHTVFEGIWHDKVQSGRPSDDF